MNKVLGSCRGNHDKFHLGEALMEEVEAGPWRLACSVPDTCLIQKTSFSLKCAEDNESEN